MQLTRTDIINALITKFNYRTYLEIGIQCPLRNFSLININLKKKRAVDPNMCPMMPKKISCEQTSDIYFGKHKNTTFDIIFIDGLHECKQVFKDIINSLNILSDNGCIVVHDCNPITEEMQMYPLSKNMDHWTGDVWKGIYKLRSKQSNIKLFTVDINLGCCIIRKGRGKILQDKNNLTWEFFNKQRKNILNLISVEEFEQWLQNKE